MHWRVGKRWGTAASGRQADQAGDAPWPPLRPQVYAASGGAEDGSGGGGDDDDLGGHDGAWLGGLRWGLWVWGGGYSGLASLLPWRSMHLDLVWHAVASQCAPARFLPQSFKEGAPAQLVRTQRTASPPAAAASLSLFLPPFFPLSRCHLIVADTTAM